MSRKPFDDSDSDSSEEYVEEEEEEIAKEEDVEEEEEVAEEEEDAKEEPLFVFNDDDDEPEEELTPAMYDPKQDPNQDDSDEDEVKYKRPPVDPKKVEANYKKFWRAVNSEQVKKAEEEECFEYVDEYPDLFNFPPDKENWKESDLMEFWADGPEYSEKPGWDPNWVDKDDVQALNEMVKKGLDLPIAPFYVPYRKYYPVIPEDHYDISTPKSVIEELDRVEEFLTWHSFVFVDGSTYEGTVWDDLAHGKGVYEAEQGLVRYEGEWLQNNPEGHGVLEVDIPTYEPIPGSEEEAKMRAEGHIFKRDFMSPEDKEWLEKDIEDAVRFSGDRAEVPFYENKEWIRQFGQKPEKGRYRYSGQWKHGRMHGCGVFELNERTSYGRFYFGEFMLEEHGCDVDASALHAGIADVAAAKARMFVNKPDGMVREERGPYSDPQHPTMYEGEDVWMAPGFINQFYEVPDYWKAYMEDVDEERQMWINSFYKAPLRLPMPAELTHWWESDMSMSPEFVLVKKEPVPDPEDPTNMVIPEDPLILHTPTGRLIDYVDDEKYGIRLFWKKDGDGDGDDEKVEFLPVGVEDDDKDGQSFWERMLTSVQDKCKSMLENLEERTEERKKLSELKMEIMEIDADIVEAQSEYKEIIKEMDDELKRQEKEEEKKIEMGLEDEDEDEDEDEEEVEVEVEEQPPPVKSEKKVFVDDNIKVNVDDKIDDDDDDVEEEDEEEDEDEDEDTPPSFGSFDKNEDSKGKKGGKSSSPFAASSLAFASMVPSQVQQLFVAWKESKMQTKACSSSFSSSSEWNRKSNSVEFNRVFPGGLGLSLSLRANHNQHQQVKKKAKNVKRNIQKQKPQTFTWPNQELSILSLHIPI